ncbi:MAG: Hsp20/alpha crystallin family protein [Myxococcota bacterium]
MLNITRGQSNVPSTATYGREWDPFRVMREMMRWDPFREMVPSGVERGGFEPRFDVCEQGDAYVFKADLPGVKEEDVEITLTGNRLTVAGKREYEQKDEQDNWFAYERGFGSFTRSFTLPEGCATDDVHAELKDGVLTLHLPKKPEVQPRKIELKKEAKVQ